MITVAVFLDFRRAFETMNYKIIISKLQNIGIKDVVLNSFSSYPFDRQQYVKFGGTRFSQMYVRCGIPQNTVQGPISSILNIPIVLLSMLPTMI